MDDIDHLPIDPSSFGFVSREIRNGKKVLNRCGRDFLYYALAYYRPDIHNPKNLNPVQIESYGLFGMAMPSWFIWTGITFARAPRYLSSLNLNLSINGIPVRSYTSFMKGMFETPKSYEESINEIENAVDRGIVSGVDIALGLGGLVDHVMFVYGYDADNLYVFDTHEIPDVPYKKITPDNDLRFIMKLPKNSIKERWARWSRVWIVKQKTA